MSSPLSPFPKVSIVSTNYNKQNQIKFFLHSIFRQTYEGKIELVLVDDRSTDITMKVVEEYVPVLRLMFPDRSFSLITIANENNLGNCRSRNEGIKRASGEIIIVTDSDCMLSKNFIASYVRTYHEEGADVVVSDFGIELKQRNPLRTLEFYENNPAHVKEDLKVQDPKFPTSFLNTVTRGFSIRKSFIRGPLYDPEFSYTDSPDSGFGWEDIEAGCTLHKMRAKISYASDSFTIHLTHRSTANPQTKALKSLKNYRKLHEKHPDLATLKKKWSRSTYKKILRHQLASTLSKNDDNVFLEKHFQMDAPSSLFKILVFIRNLVKKDLKIVMRKNTLRMPHFLIIGTIKGGTSSLYSYLGRHPDICRALSKEVGYYSDHYDKGPEWYMSQFPALQNHYQGIVTGEASPTYLEYDRIARRMSREIPNAKIIVLLRNPIDRAYSNYQMLVRHQKTTLSFEELVEEEMHATRPETNYLARGEYQKYLASWFSFFPKQQIMIIKTEDFEENPEKYLLQVHDFLQVPRQILPAYSKINAHKEKYPPMNHATRLRLAQYYKPHNEALEKLLNREFFWDH